MGSRGPKPKSKERKTIALKKGIPPPPLWLDKESCDEYMRVANLLSDTGIITLADRAHLTAYAQAWGEFEKLCQSIAETGYTIHTEKGHPVVNPEIQARSDAHRRLLASASKLGLSIVDRERITIPKEKNEKDPLEEFGDL
jgi:P27 family predicted phage terminase small subunit